MRAELLNRFNANALIKTSHPFCDIMSTEERVTRNFIDAFSAFAAGELVSWARTVSIGFERSNPGFFDRLATAHTLATEGLTCYLGTCSDKPVATSTLYASEKVAGIHVVSTIPEFRGRGFGAAMSALAVREGFQSGCDLSSLQATPMGFPMYLKMGFRYILDYLNWIVSPRYPTTHGRDGKT